MVVMVMDGCSLRHAAAGIMADFMFCFQFQCCVADTQSGQFLTNFLLCLMWIPVCDNMHGGAVVLAVYAPYMHVVHIYDTLNFADLGYNLMEIDFRWRFIQKDFKGIFQRFQGLCQDEQSDGDGHNGVNENEAGEFYHNGAKEYNYPAQYILQHMQIYGPLIQGVATMCEKDGAGIHTDAQYCKNDHAMVMDIGWGEDSVDCIIYHRQRANDQNHGRDQTARDRVTPIPIGVYFIRLLPALFLHEIRYSDADRIPRVVDGIGKNGDTSRKNPAKEFEDGKGKIQDKCDEDVFLCMHGGLLLIYAGFYGMMDSIQNTIFIILKPT